MQVKQNKNNIKTWYRVLSSFYELAELILLNLCIQCEFLKIRTCFKIVG